MTIAHPDTIKPEDIDALVDTVLDRIFEAQPDTIYFQLQTQADLRKKVHILLKNHPLSQESLSEFIQKQAKYYAGLITGLLKNIAREFEKDFKGYSESNANYALYLEDAAIDSAVTYMQRKMGMHEAVIDHENGALLQSIRVSFGERMNVYTKVIAHKEIHQNFRPKKSKAPRIETSDKCVRTKEPTRSMAAMNRAIPETAKNREGDSTLYIREIPERPLFESRVRGVKL